MRTEAPEENEPAYNEWHTTTPEELAAKEKLHPAEPGQSSEPSWREGVPRRMRRLCGSPEFFANNVRHRYRSYFRTVELDWTHAVSLPLLRENPNYLPSSRHSGEWSGVYRLFAQNMAIDRSCGKDATGTLYIGRAGTGRQKWSILYSRIKNIVDRQHHAFRNWNVIEMVREKFPWDSLAVQWACTGQSLDFKGDSIAKAEFAESFLLCFYKEAFGEYPPWNQRG